jgi:hypothetical protein
MERGLLRRLAAVERLLRAADAPTIREVLDAEEREALRIRVKLWEAASAAGFDVPPIEPLPALVNDSEQIQRDATILRRWEESLGIDSAEEGRAAKEELLMRLSRPRVSDIDQASTTGSA